MPKKLKLSTPITQPHADGSSNTLDEALIERITLDPVVKSLTVEFALLEASSGARADHGADFRAWDDLPADVQAAYNNLVERTLNMLAGGKLPAGAVEDL